MKIFAAAAPPPKTSFPKKTSRRTGSKLFCPKFAGKLSGYALNVPVQRGSLLDVNCVMQNSGITVDQVNDAMRSGRGAQSGTDRLSAMIQSYLPT
jgi:glyceraldehyde-3-phosphate dehydrogenase/erythrose-4-phosphate dehydrogenase